MPRLLWFSPCALHDTSSGAALQCRIMLYKLRQRGVQITALGGLIFDHPAGKALLEKTLEQVGPEKTSFTVRDSGIDFIYARTERSESRQIRGEEQDRLFIQFLKLLETFRPDVIMGYGGDMLSMTVRAEARRRGIPVVYTLWNGNHKAFAFPDCDLVITDSQATSAHYRQQFGINVIPAGAFILPEMVRAEQREPRYITLVNPSPAKGVAILARLALMAQKELPDARFLALQSRGDFAACLPQLHLPDSEEKPLVMDMFPNVDRARHMTNMKPIYAATRVLLAPSLWYESWGRVATEAVLNGIPVLASRSGGLPEAVGEGGICLDAPEACRKDPLRLPTEEEMRPWMDALKRLLAEDWTEPCARAAAAHDVERHADRLLELLQPLFDRRASWHPQYFRSGMNVK
ncbi:MAG: glycosyltransferase [Desulfovibrio sp.]|uniref:glycosyltransferase n=1 Tax=Desulfovibrio sp. TaxID=885 RepID=UPI0025C397AD|nr:glycosyltransferase [Desulfovibrio sp.]MCI7568407.1 glycosyltransferase [Desulfovibrio sp.]